MLLKTQHVDYDLERTGFLQIYTYMKANLDHIKKIQIIYKKDGQYYITENISLEWASQIDSHGFFKWLEFKKAQKQRYNTQAYEIVWRMYKTHASR